MLRITRETDYGIVLLSLMARQPQQSFSAAALAERQRLPVPMVSKILKLLAKAGLLESRRGAQGGYSLAREAPAISAADIISALEGPIAITECSSSSEDNCVHQEHCGISSHWQRINSAIYNALAGISLAELSQLQQPMEFYPREAVLALRSQHS